MQVAHGDGVALDGVGKDARRQHRHLGLGFEAWPSKERIVRVERDAPSRQQQHGHPAQIWQDSKHDDANGQKDTYWKDNQQLVGERVSIIFVCVF